MKKFILMFVCAAFTLGAYAQTPAKKATATKAKQAAVKTEFVCPMCNTCSDHAGKCADCEVAMVKSGSYYCSECHTTSAKAGKCSKCGMDMAKVECKKATEKEKATEEKPAEE